MGYWHKERGGGQQRKGGNVALESPRSTDKRVVEGNRD